MLVAVKYIPQEDHVVKTPVLQRSQEVSCELQSSGQASEPGADSK